ncbi:hypothetical protein [Streptomyces sp. NPDC014656]|uniref:hypothetical protein n=1 Tax=Streptomyces sp. NPDC014656 TaxID=3364878 RepID=UPI0036FDBCC4
MSADGSRWSLCSRNSLLSIGSVLSAESRRSALSWRSRCGATAAGTALTAAAVTALVPRRGGGLPSTRRPRN